MPEALYINKDLSLLQNLSHMFFSLPRNFRSNIIHSFENIAKTLSVALEVSLSIRVYGCYMKDARLFVCS